MQVALALLFSMPTMLVLIGSGYITAWLAAGVGCAVYVLATPVLGRHQGHRLGRMGLLALLCVILFGILAHDTVLNSQTSLVQRLVEPLQALGLLLGGESEAARQLHPGVVERVMLWGKAWEGFKGHWVLGTGMLAPMGEEQALAGYQDYASLLASVASGLGLLGLVGFMAVVLLPLRALVWANLSRHWHPVWGLGILSCGVTVLT